MNRLQNFFNLLNLVFGLTLGIVVPVAAFAGGTDLSVLRWLLLSGGPILIMIVIALLTRLRHHEAARITFFILHPLLLCFIYIAKIDIGTDLFFICYGVLSVFFLHNIHLITFTFSFSLTCYFLSLGLVKASGHSIETSHIDLYLFNRLLAIFFIFYGIFIIRNENSRYQLLILDKNRELRSLNSLKNKLFSVVAHDLRSPLYAMHQLFRNFVQFDLPADEIKQHMPELARTLADTTGHIENLLQWARIQMHSGAVHPQLLEISAAIREVLSFLRLQAEGKQLRIESLLENPVYVFADKEMVNLILRNLLSNAIKFTPEHGLITLDAKETADTVEVFVQDSGVGISDDHLQKLQSNIHHTTAGTANESGTGLGLLLCREFLHRHGGRLQVSSKIGKGSTFSFTLPVRT